MQRRSVPISVSKLMMAVLFSCLVVPAAHAAPAAASVPDPQAATVFLLGLALIAASRFKRSKG
jgi:hypothetical protein